MITITRYIYRLIILKFIRTVTMILLILVLIELQHYVDTTFTGNTQEARFEKIRYEERNQYIDFQEQIIGEDMVTAIKCCMYCAHLEHCYFTINRTDGCVVVLSSNSVDLSSAPDNTIEDTETVYSKKDADICVTADCYVISEYNMNFASAVNYCADRGLHLVSIDSDREYNLVIWEFFMSLQHSQHSLWL